MFEISNKRKHENVNKESQKVVAMWCSFSLIIHSIYEHNYSAKASIRRHSVKYMFNV